MKSVWLSEKDRFVIKMSVTRAPIGDLKMDGMRANVKMQDKLDLDGVTNDLDKCCGEVKEYVVEDDQLKQATAVLDLVRKTLPMNIVRDVIACEDHLGAAKDVEKG